MKTFKRRSVGWFGVVASTVVLSQGVVQAQIPSDEDSSKRSDSKAPPSSDEQAESPTGGQGTVEDFIEQLDWIKNGVGKLGDRAQLTVPEGYRFGPTETAIKLLTAMGNIPGGDELALVGPDGLSWFVVYDFQDVGYVKDDEKDELNPAEMLSTMRSGLEEENAYRKQRGVPTVDIVGWAIEPRYDPETNVLEWATKAEFTSPDGNKEISVNYKTKILGRKGVMNIIVVCDPDELDTVLPQYKTLMQGFNFIEGEKYAEYKPGDRVAQYGLAALVAGGAVAVAAKTGLFAAIVLFFKKGAKFLVLAVGALIAAVSRLFSGRKRN